MKENTALSPIEQRQAERHAPLESRQGKLTLSVEGQSGRHGISMLRDISPFGVGVESSLLVEKGKLIRLTYEERNLALEVVGTVAWNQRAGATDADITNQVHHQMGIQLHPADIERNIHFFRYMAGVE